LIYLISLNFSNFILKMANKYDKKGIKKRKNMQNWSIIRKLRPHLRKIKPLILNIKPTRWYLLIKFWILIIFFLYRTDIVRITKSRIGKFIVIFILDYHYLALYYTFDVDVIDLYRVFFLVRALFGVVIFSPIITVDTIITADNLWLSLWLKELVLFLHHVRFCLCLTNNISRLKFIVRFYWWLFAQICLRSLILGCFTVNFCWLYLVAEFTWCSLVEYWICQW